jgi:hypothetical protein
MHGSREFFFVKGEFSPQFPPACSQRAVRLSLVPQCPRGAVSSAPPPPPPQSSCSGPHGGDCVLPVLKTLNWQWNLMYCYVHSRIRFSHYSFHTTYTKNERGDSALEPEHTTRVARIGQYGRPVILLDTSDIYATKRITLKYD